MKLKEIEKMLNEYIAIDEVQNKEMTYSECQNVVNKKVYEILAPFNDLLQKERIYVASFGDSNDKGNVYVRSHNIKSCFLPLLTIKIHRKKGPGRVSIWSSYSTYYLKSVEFELNGHDFETVQDMVDYVAKKVKERKESEDNKLNNFINQLDEFDLQFCEFRRLLDLYNYLNYNQKAELEKQLEEV